MLIHLEKIKPEGLFLDFVEDAGKFPVLKDVADSGEGSLSGPVSVSLRLFRVGDKIELTGRLEARGNFPCSRCLEEFEEKVSSEFFLVLIPESDEEDKDDEEELELSQNDLGVVYFSGETIDVSDLLQEQILMAFPTRPLCSGECRGLCPQCGKNLNSGSCECESPSFNNKFSILKDLVKP